MSTQQPRYEPLLKLAAGGMATVWIGAARGGLGFRQVVAIKKPHPHLLDRPEFRREIVAEARLASLLHHANVVDVRDVEVEESGEVSLIMDYVEGATFAQLIVDAAKQGKKLPPSVVVRIGLDALAGLHAAHELVDEKGRPVRLVHRDVSPQNILVGIDGHARVSDFGIAKLAELSTTHGSLKGKISYMAPEYLRGEKIDRRFDIFAMGIVLWEALAGQRLFRGENDPDTFNRILQMTPPKIGTLVPSLGTALDGVLEVALAKSREERFDNALAMASALETCARGAGLDPRHREVADVVASLEGAMLEARRKELRDKLGKEPGLLSLMNPPSPITLADQDVRPTVPEPRRAGRGDAAMPDAGGLDPAAPPMVPMTTLASPGARDAAALPMTTLASPGATDAAPRAEPPPPAIAVTTLASEPTRGELAVESRPEEPMARSALPSVAIAGAVAGLLLAGGALFVIGSMKHGVDAGAQAVSAATTVTPDAGSTTATAAQPSATMAASAPARASGSESATAPTPKTARSGKAKASASGPPPNPYLE